MRKHRSKRLTALVLALILCLSLVVPVGAVGISGGTNVRFEQVDNSVVSATLRSNRAQREQAETPLYQDTDKVRVSIFLEKPSTLEEGFSTENIAANTQAMSYRKELKAQQDAVARRISKDALGGEELDIVWNLTLAANLISANVAYGDIEAIKAVPGVADVVLETRYEPDVVRTDATDPNMATSSSMIGSGSVWETGYYGAGSRVAVIDTGTDSDHQSFNAEAFHHALEEDAAAAGKTVASYGLLDAAEIARKLPLLNIAEEDWGSVTDAEKLYVSEKLPFAYNYVDQDYDITHDNDDMGEHGSHVAGISTANRYLKSGDTFVSALDIVSTQGVAPDAQLITMKVFGKEGGAYDADYMAAIEDAIILGCDSINLSLGSTNPGMSVNKGYQKILDSISQHGSVVTVSAGNSGSWATNAASGGYLYSDGVNLDTVGSPGSTANALTVASVDNIGSTSYYLSFADKDISVYETEGKNRSLSTLDTTEDASGTEYSYVFFENAGVDADGKSYIYPYADAIQGKIVFVSRGESAFMNKHYDAQMNGAVGCVVYNNTTGSINMDLSTSRGRIPCVGITQDNGAWIKEHSTPVMDGDTVLYYTGTLKIYNKMKSSIDAVSEYYTMSSFSAWGVPGSLLLKPEITAPGGNIYSVNGLDKSGTAYENMSGTSMAAPQANGMAALMAEYMKDTGLAEKTGHTRRQLIQSLLMSTATPLLEADSEYYYSVLKQGSGLANVADAIAAHSYLWMGEGTNSGAADGKIKVELGEDAAKKGVYTFSFTINNLLDTAATYDLSADVFTQDLFTEEGNTYLDYLTRALEGAEVRFSTGESVTVPANGSAQVEVTLDVTGCQALAEYPVGAYIEAYVFAKERATAEGETGTVHSIPVLGFYGNYTEASMFDVGSYQDYVYGTETRANYLNNQQVNSALVAYADDPQNLYFFGPNAYGVDDEYLPERNAFSTTSGDAMAGFIYAQIRASAAGRMQVTDAKTGQVYDSFEFSGSNGAFYYTNRSAWMDTAVQRYRQWAGTDAEGNQLPEGTTVNYTLTLVPEYYTTVVPEGENTTKVQYVVDWDALTDGKLENGELGAGVSITTQATIDNTAPVIESVELKDSSFVIQAKDNRHIACISVYDANGIQLLKKILPNQTEANTAYTTEVDMSEVYGNQFILAVMDYANNMATYRITAEKPFNGQNLEGAILGLNLNGGSGCSWIAVKDGQVSTVTSTDYPAYGGAYAGGYIFTTVYDSANKVSTLYVADQYTLNSPTALADIAGNIQALTYDRSTETLYGLSSGELLAIDMVTGETESLGLIAGRAEVTNTLATDSKGTFYYVESDSGKLYSFTLETIAEPTFIGATGYKNSSVQGLAYDNNTGKLYWAQHYYVRGGIYCDLNGDYRTNEKDAQIILDYVAGKLDSISPDADVNGDGKINSFDAHMILNMNTTSNYTMAYLLELDLTDATPSIVCQLPEQTASLVIPDDSTVPAVLDTKEVSSVSISDTSLELLRGGYTRLVASAQPWTLDDHSVSWSSSDEKVARVNANGLVTAVAEGTATITATANANPDISASCEVTVTLIDMTIYGALQDEDTNSKLFTWDLTKDTWTAGSDLEHRIAAVGYDKANDTLYVMDNTTAHSVHKVDAATGETLESYENPTKTLFNDLSTSVRSTKEKPVIHGIWDTIIGYEKNPANLTITEGADMDFFMSYYDKATRLVAVASAGFEDYTRYDTTYQAEKINALDDKGNIWTIWTYTDELGPTYAMGFTKSNLQGLDFPEFNGNSFCSMVTTENGDIILSRFTGDTNELYRMRYSKENNVFYAESAGTFGDGIWPAALYNVELNGSADSTAAEGPEAMMDERKGIWDMESVEETAETATVRDTVGTLSVTPGQGDSKTVTLDLNAENSTNGKLTVGYDTDVLTLTAVEPTDAALNSFVTAEDGTVTFAYANKTAVNGKLATLTFSYDSSSAPKTTVATVTTLEEGGSQKEIAQKVTLTLKDEVVVPVGPSEPSKPSTPTEPEKPDFPFKDVTTDHPFYEDIKYVYEKGLMQGVSEDIFQSGTTTTRGMIATILYRMEGEPAVKNASSFRDVADGMYYSKAIVWAAANGIVNGYADGSFQPDQTISREQMAAILYRYAQYKGCDVSVGEDTNILSYTDATQVATYAVPAFQWAVGAGIINGTTASTLSPKGSATRGQVAAILHRYCEWIG